MSACCNCNKTEHSLYCLCGGCYDAIMKEKGEPEPLTLEELSNRAGKPVYIVYNSDGDGMWRIVHIVDECFSGACGNGNYIRFEDNSSLEEWNYGKTWLAYDRQPMEGVKQNNG